MFALGCPQTQPKRTSATVAPSPSICSTFLPSDHPCPNSVSAPTATVELDDRFPIASQTRLLLLENNTPATQSDPVGCCCSENGQNCRCELQHCFRRRLSSGRLAIAPPPVCSVAPSQPTPSLYMSTRLKSCPYSLQTQATKCCRRYACSGLHPPSKPNALPISMPVRLS